MGGDLVRLDGCHLSLEAVELVAEGAKVVLEPAVAEQMAPAREAVQRAMAAGEVVYGVTTGFGRLAGVSIPSNQAEELQVGLLRSHAVGLGPPLSRPVVRAILLLRGHVLAMGFSGVRPVLVERLVELLNRGVYPVIPCHGSVGASGDLVPLAHLALVLIGEGEAEVEGDRLPGGEALARAGLPPLKLEAKEGLALINGTQVMLALGILALRRAERLAASADVIGALSLESLLGSVTPFREAVHRVRPHPGQIQVARTIRGLLADSETPRVHGACRRVQDAYSIRCMPQVHGAVRDSLAHIRRILEIEVDSATDNPLVFPEAEDVFLSAGNFHGQPLSIALDLLAIALASLANISERRLERLLNPDLSGLPAFLAKRPGMESGLMILQVMAAELASRNKVMAHPASVDTIPTGAAQEDHVSMGVTAALKAWEVLEATERILALEWVAAAQGVEFLGPIRLGNGTRAAHTLLREVVAPLEGDRALGKELEEVVRLVQVGRLAAIARDAEAQTE